MKLSKGQIIMLIITGVIVIANFIYFQISKIDEPIFIKRYSELFYDTNINLEFIRDNTSIKEKEEDFFESNITSNIMNIEFPEINKSYDMASYSYNLYKNKYEYLTYRLGVNEHDKEDGLYDYIDKNGPVKLTRAILNTYDGKTYDVDLGEIILNPFNTNANRPVKESGYSGDGNEDSMIWIAEKDIYINKIESKYLEELKKYYDFSLLIGDEKIPIDKIKYPLSIKENTKFSFISTKKKDAEVDVESIYDTEIKIEIEGIDKKKGNLYVRVRNIDPYDMLNEKNILKLKY
ncbi:hypothetical protein [Clostridium sardiniense]|uniref:hypothetical protein n=1 Tax=Clostridium sardiniense TaxID=29369 RepID=UPI003D32B0B6